MGKYPGFPGGEGVFSGVGRAVKGLVRKLLWTETARNTKGITTTMTTFSRPETMRTILFALFVAVSLIFSPGAEEPTEENATRFRSRRTRIWTPPSRAGTSSSPRAATPSPERSHPRKGEWKQVCLGDYAGRDEALKAAEAMREKGHQRHFPDREDRSRSSHPRNPVPRNPLPEIQFPTASGSGKGRTLQSRSPEGGFGSPASTAGPCGVERRRRTDASPPSARFAESRSPPPAQWRSAGRPNPPQDSAPSPEKGGAADAEAEERHGNQCSRRFPRREL